MYIRHRNLADVIYHSKHTTMTRTILSALKEGVSLRRAYLGNLDLSWIDIPGVDLREAWLRGTDLSFVDLEGADLRGTNLGGTNLEYACLANIKTDEKTNFGGAKR